MDEGGATVVSEASVEGDQFPVGSTVLTGALEEAVGAEQHAEGVTVPLVVPEEVVGVDKSAEDSTVPVVAPDEAVDGDQHAEGSTVPMVLATDEAVDGDQHSEGSPVPMVAPEEVVGVDQHAGDIEQHVEGLTVPRVVPDEAVDMEQHVEALAPAPVVNPEVAADGDHHIEDAASQGKHGDIVGIINVTPEEMRGIIQVIADTGKFWHEWSYLKRVLSVQLMQVLDEYSEAQMLIRADGQRQNSSSAETNSELFSQLNDALLRFEEGPPFTLQRLCEILLDPKGTYKKLSKLTLALEKTLLVTSTISRCTGPYPAAAHGPSPEETAMAENTDPVVAPAEPERSPENQPAAVPNGTEHAGEGDGDEEMADAEAEVAVPSGGSHDDVEMQEEKPDHMVDVVGSGVISGGTTVAGETAFGGSGQSPDPQS